VVSASVGREEIIGNRLRVVMNSICAMANVPMAKYTPRSLKLGAPMISAKATGTSAPKIMLTERGHPFVQRMRLTSEPRPKKAACPRLTWPAMPPMMFQLEAIITYM
jgi:hypothetical protein